ncbi:MAG: hypothetical protein M1436_04420, partial [Acidobacteria bacterium]|nr:hypothetical protein [Acidobacteriota bacterium]
MQAASSQWTQRDANAYAPADVMRIYGASDIPETEDLYNNGRYDFLKLAASAGHVYGHKIVSSESFVWMGKAYQTTPEKIKRYADELITAGINQIIYHGFPYEYMDRPEPGWHPFSSPLPFSSHMNQHNPFWPYIPRINAYITRLQYISQQGVNIAPVALYRSALSYDAVEPPEPEPEINTRLMAAGYNFDHINTDALLKSRVAQGRLVTPGGSRYSALVLQNEPQIPVELAEKLAAFAKGGLRIVFIGCVPQGESGLAGAGEKSAKVKQLMAAMRSVPSAEAAVAALSKSTQPNLRFTGASVPFIEKRVGAIDTFFFRNPDAEPREIQAEVAAAGSPEQWDAWTGGIQPFTAFTRQGKKVKLSLHLEPYGSALLAFDAAVRHKPAAAPSQAASAASVIEIGGSGWKFHGAGLAGDTGNLEIPKLLDWRSINALKSFSGRGLYETSFEATPEMLGGNRRLWLDLGDVKDVAEVKINGKPGPTLILRPYRADVTGLVQRGRNTLEITVINTLYNAIDARGGKINQFPGMAGLSSAQPMPSGLMGPV